MKRFRWPLQRLLDVTEQRELAVRAALYSLSREMVQLRQRILRRQISLRSLLGELSQQEFPQRLPSQALFLSCCETARAELEQMNQMMRQLEQQRTQKTQELLTVRARRQMLENLRQRARQRYQYEQQTLEQKELDEVAQVAFVRQESDEPAVR